MGLLRVELRHEVERIGIRHLVLVPFYSNPAFCCSAPVMGN